MAIDSQAYATVLDAHYSSIWGPGGIQCLWDRGPALPQQCRVFECAPTDKTFSWVYATCGMTPLGEPDLLELFILSPCQTESHIELLTAVAHYHQTGATLGLGHTVDFGRAWLGTSRSSFGLISLPYPFGPDLEKAHVVGKSVRILWLIPITPEERALKISHGLSALEDLFEKQQFNYLDPFRSSVTA